MTPRSAARLSAGDAEDPIAASSPAVRFVGVLPLSHLALSARDFENRGNVAGTKAPTRRLITV